MKMQTVQNRGDSDDEVDVERVHETAGAYALRRWGTEEKPEWFPRSQVHFASYNLKTRRGKAVIPGWLLKDRGWNT